MDSLINTFLHSIAWHVGTSLAHTLGAPLIIVFVIFTVLRFFRN